MMMMVMMNMNMILTKKVLIVSRIRFFERSVSRLKGSMAIKSAFTSTSDIGRSARLASGQLCVCQGQYATGRHGSCREYFVDQASGNLVGFSCFSFALGRNTSEIGGVPEIPDGHVIACWFETYLQTC